jgi:GAF domain-containing protein
LTLDDPDVDDAEASVLRQHGFGSLVMLPLELNDEVWGLVEVYRVDRRPFTPAEIARATEISRLR